MKSRNAFVEPSALALIEEAVHLLRRAPVGLLAVYYAGSVPFVLGLLFFWADTTWFRPPGEVVAWSALGLVALFAVMKAAQAEFCAGLMQLRLGAAPPPWSWARFRRLGRAQLQLQPLVLLVLGPALALTVPFGWVWAYAQSTTVIGEAEHLHSEAQAQAVLWPRQNHRALLLLSGLASCLWLNFATAFYLVPWLANRFLGLDNVFGFSGWWFLNTTFLASITALTWLAMDPLVKAFYTLRVFHGRARRTGEDVRVDLQLGRRASALRAAAALVFVLCCLPVEKLSAAEPAPRPATVEPAKLDRAIDDVLSGSNFSWRLRPLPGAEKEKENGPVARFFLTIGDAIRDFGRALGDIWKKITDWIDRHTRSSSPKVNLNHEDSTTVGGGVVILRALLYIFAGIAVLLLLWLGWTVWRQMRGRASSVLTAKAVATAATPDLRDENVQAALLPADGWLALAREKAAAGEWRLALRALYLAMLARLAADRLISLAAFKTNLDYERELRRRALPETEVLGNFVRRRRSFEEVWYGRTEAEAAEVNAWLNEMETR